MAAAMPVVRTGARTRLSTAEPACFPAVVITAQDALTFPAVQLFLERATAGGAHLALTDIDASVIAEICRRLDGIPLALELAAGGVGVYGIQGTASLLEHRFRLLWQGSRTALPRHQTLSSVLDWSYNLLSDLERTVLRRLSIFVGFFSMDGVATVAGDGDGEHAIDILGSLVEKSLVSVDAARYRLLDTTRSHARRQLDEAKELDAIARRHATYMCEVLEQEGSEVDGAHSLSEYLGDVRAALTWSFSDSGDTALGA